VATAAAVLHCRTMACPLEPLPSEGRARSARALAAVRRGYMSGDAELDAFDASLPDGFLEEAHEVHFSIWKNNLGAPLTRRTSLKATPEVSHYTSLAGMEGVLCSGAFWATASASTNDDTETSYAHRLLRSVSAEYAATKPGCPHTQALHELIDGLYARDSPFPLFVTSFSARADNLDMWRGYGAGGVAVELIFDTAQIFDATINKAEAATMFSPVIYDHGDQTKILRGILDHYCDATARLAGKYPSIERTKLLTVTAGLMNSTLVSITCTVKNPKFETEGEWRISHVQTEPGKVKHSFIRDRLTQYVILGHLRDEQGRLPLVGVRIGPHRRELDVSGIKTNVSTFLAGLGYDPSKLMLPSDCPLKI